MTKADEIRKEIKLKRKQLAHYAGFVRNPVSDLLFRDINILNKQLSIEIEKENEKNISHYLGKEKSFDEDAKEIDDKQRLRDLKS